MALRIAGYQFCLLHFLWVPFKTDLWFLLSSGHTLRKFCLFGNKVSSLCAQDGLEPLGWSCWSCLYNLSLLGSWDCTCAPSHFSPENMQVLKWEDKALFTLCVCHLDFPSNAFVRSNKITYAGVVGWRGCRQRLILEQSLSFSPSSSGRMAFAFRPSLR